MNLSMGFLINFELFQGILNSKIKSAKCIVFETKFLLKTSVEPVKNSAKTKICYKELCKRLKKLMGKK